MEGKRSIVWQTASVCHYSAIVRREVKNVAMWLRYERLGSLYRRESSCRRFSALDPDCREGMAKLTLK